MENRTSKNQETKTNEGLSLGEISCKTRFTVLARIRRPHGHESVWCLTVWAKSREEAKDEAFKIVTAGGNEYVRTVDCI